MLNCYVATTQERIGAMSFIRALFNMPRYTPAEQRALHRAQEDLKEAVKNGVPHGYAEFYDEKGQRRVMCASADGAVTSWELQG